MSSVAGTSIPRGSSSSDRSSPAESDLRISGIFPLLYENLDTVLAQPRMFWSIPPGSEAGFSFGGSFPVPLGIWALAWKKGIGTCDCAHCGGAAFPLSARGGMSMGESYGYCSECGERWESRAWSIGTWGFLRTELLKRVDALDLSEGRYPEAYPFDELVAHLAGTI